MRLIRATYPKLHGIPLKTVWFKNLSRNIPSAIALTEQKMTFSGQTFAMTPMTQMQMTPTAIYRTYRRTSFFRWRRFLRFWTIKLTFITFAYEYQYFVVDWSRRVFTGEKVNWPAGYSCITLDSRYMIFCCGLAADAANKQIYLALWNFGQVPLLKNFSCIVS